MDPEFNLNVSGLRVTSDKRIVPFDCDFRRRIVKRVKSLIQMFLTMPSGIGLRRTENTT